MKLTISDTSFHKKIMSRYRKGKGSLFVFPSMFFLKCARSYLSRIIDMHVRLNFQIHNKYMDISSVLLQKFHEMKVIFSGVVPEKHAPHGVLYRLNNTLTLSRIHELISEFHEINKISVNGTIAIFKTPIFSIENYNSKKLVSFRKENSVYEKSISNFPMIINQISNFPTIDTDISARTMNDHVLNYSIKANNSILQRSVYSQIFNHIPTAAKYFFSSDSAINNIFSNYVQTMSNTIIPSRIISSRTFYHPLMPTPNNYFTQAKPVNYWDSNYLQTVNNVIRPGILNKTTINYQTAAYNFFTSGRTVDNHISNYMQIGNNIFSYPRVFNDVNSLNYLRTENAQSLDGGNNSTMRIIDKNYNTIFKESTNFWKEKMEKNRHILKFNSGRIAQSTNIIDSHKRKIFSARIIDLDFAIPLKPKVHNGIKGSNNNAAGSDIVFKKSHSENKIPGEKKLNDEITISAKIRADKQIKNVPPQILRGEISSIADKVYKLLERRLSIEKEKRGVHIIG